MSPEWREESESVPWKLVGPGGEADLFLHLLCLSLLLCLSHQPAYVLLCWLVCVSVFTRLFFFQSPVTFYVGLFTLSFSPPDSFPSFVQCPEPSGTWVLSVSYVP